MKNRKSSALIVLLVMLYMVIPIVFTILYAISTKWQITLLPEGFTLKHFHSLFINLRFYQAVGRSLSVSIISIALSFTLLLPVIYMGKVHFPWLNRIMRFVSMIPFAISGVILAVGLIKLYSSGPLAISGTVFILIGAYFVVIMPFMYQGIKTSLDTLEVKTLIDAAKLLGASEWETFWKVIFPNLIKGVSVSVLLSFAILMGEFVLSNILVGGNYETIQVFMFWSRGVSGHYSSAIVTSYFILIVAVTALILYLNKYDTKRG